MKTIHYAVIACLLFAAIYAFNRVCATLNDALCNGVNRQHGYGPWSSPASSVNLGSGLYQAQSCTNCNLTHYRVCH